MTFEEKDLVLAFEQMWGLYPFPVLLLDKAHRILGVNRQAAGLGVAPGIHCFALAGRDSICRHCKAAQARKSGAGIRETAFDEAQAKVLDGFWIPVQGHEDYYVHFGNDITEFADPRVFPRLAAAGESRTGR